MESKKVQIRLKTDVLKKVDAKVLWLNKQNSAGQPRWTRSSFVTAAVHEKLSPEVSDANH